jgi:hypothetical protein
MHAWLLAIALAFPATGHAAAPVDSTPVQIMALPSALREQFAQRVLAGHPTHRDRLESMVDFVFAANGLGMRIDCAAGS